jgi:CheY-like chemotaxis protein
VSPGILKAGPSGVRRRPGSDDHGRWVPSGGKGRSRLVIVDSSITEGGALSHQLTATGHYTVVFFDDPSQAIDHARRSATDPPQAVLLDLLYPGSAGDDGLAMLRAFARWCPESALLIHAPQGDHFPDLLGQAWDAHQPLSVVAKSVPFDVLLGALDEVVRTGAPQVDPWWRAALAARRSGPGEQAGPDHHGGRSR